MSSVEPDVIVVGAGPAGAIAGLVLARAGVRVRIVDRATFPRDKLCGDTVNPGTLAQLSRLGVSARVEAGGLRIEGMRVTGEGGVQIDGRYPRGIHGRAMIRREFDWALLQHAMIAGCEFEPGVTVRGSVVIDDRGAPRVAGVTLAGSSGGEATLRARVVIAADGRHSTLAFGLGLARHPERPRRWAIGAYFDGVGPVSDPCRTRVGPVSDRCRTRVGPVSDPVADFATVGEMHVRTNCYIGIAPVPGGLTNVCLVRAARGGDPDLHDPAALLHRALTSDPWLRDRFASARMAGPPVMLGPLAVDVRPSTLDGLLLAGDAAGFIDPMTGDGLRFATGGGELAAHAALHALEHGWVGVRDRLAAARAREFGGKWRFNRALRTLVGSPGAVSAAALGARIAPAVLRAVIARAGDCDLAA
ncbi:MAG: NAD(P)/FAD-dependent oxidoreductase [Vicinamibacterales bacterium]